MKRNLYPIKAIKDSAWRRMFLVALFVTLVVATIVVPSGQAATPVSVQQSDAYDFPIKPVPEQWKAFKTKAEKLEACQIPDDVLNKMSTSGLVETVINYPFMQDMRAYNDLQVGFDNVVKGFNGLQALLGRNNAGTELLKRYSAMDPAEVDETWTLSEKGDYDVEFMIVEVLLAQKEVRANMTNDELQDLLAESLAKSHAKMQHPDIYGHNGQEYTALVIGRILQQLNVTPIEQIDDGKALQEFLAQGSLAR